MKIDGYRYFWRGFMVAVVAMTGAPDHARFPGLRAFSAMLLDLQSGWIVGLGVANHFELSLTVDDTTEGTMTVLLVGWFGGCFGRFKSPSTATWAFPGAFA